MTRVAEVLQWSIVCTPDGDTGLIEFFGATDGAGLRIPVVQRPDGSEFWLKPSSQVEVLADPLSVMQDILGRLK